MCSAQMITNAREDGRQLLTTAWHCEGSDPTRPTEDWIAIFGWRTPGCVDPEEAPPQSNSVQGTLPLYRDILVSSCPGWPGSGEPGSPEDSWWECGGTDVMVVELLEPIPESYNVFLNGFNSENGVPHAFAGPTGISHPAGDVTKLALSRAPAGVNSWRQPGPADTHWSVVWEVGGNQGGSSGSAVFDDEGLQRGVLTGGSGSCTRQLGQRSAYGRFGFAWDRRGWEWASGSNSGPTLSELLDPEDSLECTPWRGADPDDPFNPIGPATDCKVQGAYLNDLRAARRPF